MNPRAGPVPLAAPVSGWSDLAPRPTRETTVEMVQIRQLYGEFNIQSNVPERQGAMENEST
jgi:hypothetical protein